MAAHLRAIKTERVAHRRQKDLVFAAKVVMRQRRRHARTTGNLGNGHVQRTGLSNRINRGFHQCFAAYRLHPELRHVNLLG
jgi:hypothetical protein